MNIVAISFRILTQEEIKKGSFVAVLNHNVFSQDGPPEHGLHDLHMGTNEYEFLCSVCRLPKGQCHGHPGSAQLNTKVIQTIASKEIPKYLRIVCPKCATLNLNYVKSRETGKLVPEKEKKCINKACGSDIIVRKDNVNKTDYTVNDKKLSPEEILKLFETITDEDLIACCKSIHSHPRNFVIDTIVVAPNTIRPLTSYGSTVEPNLTTQLYVSIIKTNNNVGKNRRLSRYTKDPDSVYNNLQSFYNELISGGNDADDSSFRGLLSRLGKKSGYIRKHILGKRIRVAARATIAGDMYNELDQIEIPMKVAKGLQMPEIVQSYNIDWLTTIFLNGKDNYPGSTFLIKKGGKKYDVSHIHNVVLEIGDTLMRDLIDDDIVLINRQPSFERSSITAVRIVVGGDIKVMLLPVLTASMYNADFDGDQMHIYKPTDIGTIAETLMLSYIYNHFISTKTSAPTIGMTQDFLIGLYKLSDDNVRINKYNVAKILPLVGITLDKPVYTGKEVISMILKQAPITYHNVPYSYNNMYSSFIKYTDDEKVVYINQGELVKGRLDKKSIGATRNSIFHVICNMYGPKVAMRVMYDLQQVSFAYLKLVGFTISVSDVLPTPKVKEEIDKLVSKLITEADMISNELLSSNIIPPINSTVSEYYEQAQINACRIPDSTILKDILGSIDPKTNGFYTMVSTGSKGSPLNYIGAAACIGQLIVDGKRPQKVFGLMRTTPYSQRFSLDPIDNGFCPYSLVSGIPLLNYYFLSTKARKDLVAKAIGTADAGTLARKNTMALQAAIVDNLRAVRKHHNWIQYVYADDGMDPRYVDKVKLSWLLWSNKKLVDTMTFTDSTCQIDIDTAVNEIITRRDKIRQLMMRSDYTSLERNDYLEYFVPINVDILLESKTVQRSDIVPGLKDRLNQLEEICNMLPYLHINEIQESAKTKVPERFQHAVYMQETVIRASLSPKRLSTMTTEEVTIIKDEIRTKFVFSLISYGSMVGMYVNQAISEPLTQILLDAPKSVNVSAGLSRVKDLLNAKPLGEESVLNSVIVVGDNVNLARDISNSIEEITTKYVTDRYTILIEHIDELQYPLYLHDKEWIDKFKTHHPLLKAPNNLTPLCCRIVLNKYALVLKAITLEEIVTSIRILNKNVYVVNNTEADDDIIIRVWFTADTFKMLNEDNINIAVDNLLGQTIRGISGIKQATMNKLQYYTILEDGTMEKKFKYTVNTVGSNLLETIKIPNVESVISSSINEDELIYGIEAARKKLISEIRRFLSDSAPNVRHLLLLADVMTRTGKILGVEKSHVERDMPHDVILHMAYNNPNKSFQRAALNDTVEAPVHSLLGALMCGTTPRLGSTYNQILLDL